MIHEETTTERRPYTINKAIETVKVAVPIEQAAAIYTTLKLAGAGRLVGRCIAEDHTDRTPSFTVYTDHQRFKCYGCGLAGDVVDLEQIGGRHVEAWTAVVALAERFGIELPRRSERWHEWTNEKDRRHKAILDALTKGYQRRFFRVYSVHLPDIEDPAEREAEAREFYADLYPVARAAAVNRLSR